MNNKYIIIQAFKEILEDGKIDNETVKKYFHKDYIQEVNGAKINYDEFKLHLIKQRQSIENISIKFNTILSYENIIFSNHNVNCIKKDGSFCFFKVIAEFRIKDGKIIFCDELTHLIKGKQSDTDMGQRF